ncbi:hypothetical protein D9758_015998 [Tetrapyrgos nigripes]|uniref:Uncharacterized protein n=1 Tax=Tetrapyrgos nigripes TaxID=182062 RepID=A0A8H5CLH3_9AGAR|nr:hypothetical protein D9758_015998 [Tetrapyrgos nigripes]
MPKSGGVVCSQENLIISPLHSSLERLKGAESFIESLRSYTMRITGISVPSVAAITFITMMLMLTTDVNAAVAQVDPSDAACTLEICVGSPAVATQAPAEGDTVDWFPQGW